MAAENVLDSIGLTKNEIKVYLSLLELGSTPTGAIIKKTKIHTSKVYDALERLSDKGLVTYVIIANTKHFQAVDPERLTDFLEDKEKEIENQKESIKSIIPELKLKQTLGAEGTDAEIFRGWKGMETVFNEGIRAMGKNDTWYVLGAYAGEDVERTDQFIARVIKMCEAKKMKWKVLYNESARKTFRYERQSPITENRFLPLETPATINIYKDVAFIALWTRDPVAFRVKNKKVADSFRKYFEVMWGMAKK